MPKSSTSSGSRKGRASSGSRSSASTSRADTASSRRTDTGKRKYRRTVSWNPLDHHLPPPKKRAGGVPEVMTDDLIGPGVFEQVYGVRDGSTLDRNAAARRRYAPHRPPTVRSSETDALRSYLLPRKPHGTVELDYASQFDSDKSFYRIKHWFPDLEVDNVADNRKGLEHGYGLQGADDSRFEPADITTSPGWPHELARRRAVQDDRDAAARERAGRFVADRTRYLRHRSLAPGSRAVREAARRYRGITQGAFDAAWAADANAGLAGPSRPPRASATSTPRGSGSASSSSSSSAAQRTARTKRRAVKPRARPKPSSRPRRHRRAQRSGGRSG